MNKLEKAQEALETVKTAINALNHAANHKRKTRGEKSMNGHYVKALQEIEKVKEHAESLVHRAEAQGNQSSLNRYNLKRYQLVRLTPAQFKYTL